jgi:branched-chain amino acid transport system ATP-binding protein
MKDNILSAKDVTVSFGGLQAIRRVNFHVKRNEILGLIGSNGAGKSTFLNVLTGLVDISGGSIFFDGENVTSKRTHEFGRMGIGRTFQTLRLLPGLTALENVLLGYHHRACKKLFRVIFRTKKFMESEAEIRERAAEKLRMVDCEGLASSPIEKLTYYERRRVEIARALAVEPKLLLLDEPAAGLNPAETAEIMVLIRRLKTAQGCSIIVIEHDMKLIMNLAERIVVLDYGEKIAEGLPGDIRNSKKVIESYLGGSESVVVG